MIGVVMVISSLMKRSPTTMKKEELMWVKPKLTVDCDCNGNFRNLILWVGILLGVGRRQYRIWQIHGHSNGRGGGSSLRCIFYFILYTYTSY
jgi:hypothetical protein